MNYRYDPQKTFIMGRYQCNYCELKFTHGGSVVHKEDCKNKDSGDGLTFVSGPETIKVVKGRASLLNSENAVTYGGLTLEKIQKHCPEAL